MASPSIQDSWGPPPLNPSHHRLSPQLGTAGMGESKRMEKLASRRKADQKNKRKEAKWKTK